MCPSGQYTIHENGATEVDTGCVDCPKGTFSTGGKVTACTGKTCAADTYSDTNGASTTDEACVACATGEVSSGGESIECTLPNSVD